MNAYSSHGRNGYRIQEREIFNAVRSHRYTAAPYLAARERHCGWHAEAEKDWLVKQSGLTPASTATLVTHVRGAIGAALVRFGQRLQGASAASLASDAAGAPGTASVAG